MNTSAIYKLIRVWGVGAILFTLRFFQNARDFDSATGLHTMSPLGIALLVVILAATALSFFLSLRQSKEKPLFSEHFSAPGRSTTALIIGTFLLAAGGGLLAKDAFSSGLFSGSASATAIASCAVAALVIIAVPCFLLLTRQMRRRQSPALFLLLPSMFFSAFWVLALYLPVANDPVLARYALPILAAAVAAYAFSQLAGFFRGETRIRTFCFVSECAVTLCLAAAAELNVHSLLYLGCALILSVFTVLQKSR